MVIALACGAGGVVTSAPLANTDAAAAATADFTNMGISTPPTKERAGANAAASRTGSTRTRQGLRSRQRKGERLELVPRIAGADAFCEGIEPRERDEQRCDGR